MIDRAHNLFFVSRENISSKAIVIRGQEFHHIKHVLRFKKDDVVDFTDGLGKYFQTRITKLDKNYIEFNIIKKEYMPRQTGLILDIAFVPLKGTRNDIIIEKGTEIGVSKFRPFISKFAVVKGFTPERIDRLERIAKSAMLQSFQYYLPELICHKNSDSLIETFKDYGLVLVADKKGHAELMIKAHSVLLMVGPEGGFDDDELQKFSTQGARLISLGNNRLRSETAALVGITKILTACHII